MFPESERVFLCKYPGFQRRVPTIELQNSSGRVRTKGEQQADKDQRSDPAFSSSK